MCVPSVSDRIAQTAATMYLEPLVEPKFHEDSYGYRPNNSSLDAVYTARKRCWKNDWTLDLDISGFFDNLDHDLALQDIKKHTDCKWVILHVERWMKALIQQADGSKVVRDKGVQQGGSVSTIISNIFMHHVFDIWMKKNYTTVPFERYVDDAIVHFGAKRKAEFIKVMIEENRSNSQRLVSVFGRFYKSEMYTSLRNIERYLIRLVRIKYKKLRDHGRLAKQFLGKVRKRSPNIFYHWTLGLGSKG